MPVDTPATARVTRVLASPRNASEARTLIDAGIDVIDAKNPDEGSLGAPAPRMIADIQRVAAAHHIPLSVALGDLQHQPGTAALAAAAAASLHADYVKAGLYGSRNAELASALMSAVATAARDVRPGIHVVACGYADYRRFAGLSPDQLIAAAVRSGCDYVMLDTYAKDGSLFDALPLTEIEDFVAAAHAQNLQVALAGSLRPEHLDVLAPLRADMIGVRGALCAASNRTSDVCPDRSAAFLSAAAQKLRSFP